MGRCSLIVSSTSIHLFITRPDAVSLFEDPQTSESIPRVKLRRKQPSAGIATSMAAGSWTGYEQGTPAWLSLEIPFQSRTGLDPPWLRFPAAKNGPEESKSQTSFREGESVCEVASDYRLLQALRGSGVWASVSAERSSFCLLILDMRLAQP